MSRSMYGLHKAIGGIEKRRHDALANLGGRTCKLHPGRSADGVIETALLDLHPACSACLTYGEARGYTIYRREG